MFEGHPIGADGIRALSQTWMSDQDIHQSTSRRRNTVRAKFEVGKEDVISTVKKPAENEVNIMVDALQLKY